MARFSPCSVCWLGCSTIVSPLYRYLTCEIVSLPDNRLLWSSKAARATSEFSSMLSCSSSGSQRGSPREKPCRIPHQEDAARTRRVLYHTDQPPALPSTLVHRFLQRPMWGSSDSAI